MIDIRLSFAAAVVACLSVLAALTADACTAIIVGRKASSTGRVIVGHNEDNADRARGAG